MVGLCALNELVVFTVSHIPLSSLTHQRDRDEAIILHPRPRLKVLHRSSVFPAFVMPYTPFERFSVSLSDLERASEAQDMNI